MKKIWQLIIIVPIVFGIIIGVGISVSNQIKNNNETKKMENIFGSLESKPAEITKFYTYGTSLNIEGKVKRNSKG